MISEQEDYIMAQLRPMLEKHGVKVLLKAVLHSVFEEYERMEESTERMTFESWKETDSGQCYTAIALLQKAYQAWPPEIKEEKIAHPLVNLQEEVSRQKCLVDWDEGRGWYHLFVVRMDSLELKEGPCFYTREAVERWAAENNYDVQFREESRVCVLEKDDVCVRLYVQKGDSWELETFFATEEAGRRYVKEKGYVLQEGR
jgi:hypothetical protein